MMLLLWNASDYRHEDDSSIYPKPGNGCCLLFMITTAIATPRSIWSKPKSNNWWSSRDIEQRFYLTICVCEQLRSSTDSEQRFYLIICVCVCVREQLRSSVEKENTVMRTSIHYKRELQFVCGIFPLVQNHRAPVRSIQVGCMHHHTGSL